MDSFRLGWISYFMGMPSDQGQSEEWRTGWLDAQRYGEPLYQQRHKYFNLNNQPVHRDEVVRESDGDAIFA